MNDFYKYLKSGNLVMVSKMIITREIPSLEIEFDEWKTPLQVVVENRDLKLCKYLVEVGAQINFEILKASIDDIDIFTFLMTTVQLACDDQNGSTFNNILNIDRILSILIEKNKIPQIGIFFKSKKFLKRYLTQGQLVTVCSGGKLDLVRIFLDYKILDVNESDLIMISCIGLNIELCYLLLGYGCQPTKQHILYLRNKIEKNDNKTKYENLLYLLQDRVKPDKVDRVDFCIGCSLI